MRAILEFNLPDEQMEFNRANQSLDMACALFDILQLKKSIIRQFNNVDRFSDDIYDGVEAMSQGIAQILEEHNINIDKLIE